MKLIVAIVEAGDAGILLRELTDRGHRATRIKTAGGFLRESNATLLLGVDDGQVDDVLAVMREHCTTRRQAVNPVPSTMEPNEFQMPQLVDVEVGGATIFVLDVVRAERLYLLADERREPVPSSPGERPGGFVRPATPALIVRITGLEPTLV